MAGHFPRINLAGNITSDITGNITSPSPSSHSNPTFSRANAFGIFVTLQLCQLTQPYGSLVFRGVSGFLWRCNPIASFVEACIIVWQLLASLVHVCLEARRRKKRGLEPVQWKRELRKEFCDKASGILLLRGAMGDDADGGLMQRLMTGSFLDRDEEAVLPVSSPAEGMSTAIQGDHPDRPMETDHSSTDIELQPLPHAMLPRALEEADPSEATPVDAPIEPRQSVLRQRTIDLESGPATAPVAISQSSSDPSDERTRLLLAAFGSNALAHREWRIDLLTAVSVATIFVKLLFIRHAVWFSAAASLTIAGWMAVQLLLILFHTREMGETDMANSLRVARILNAELEAGKTFWQTVYVILHLPILGYPSYLFAFRFKFPHGFHWLGFFLQHVFAFLAAIVARVCAAAAIPCFFVGAAFLCSELFCKGLLLLGASPLLMYLYLANWTYSQKIWPIAKYNNNTDHYVPLFTNPTLDMLVDSGYHNTITGIWLLVILGILTAIFCSTLLVQYGEGPEGKRILRKRISIGNAVVAAGMFVWYILIYDALHTYKPNWLDWLG